MIKGDFAVLVFPVIELLKIHKTGLKEIFETVTLSKKSTTGLNKVDIRGYPIIGEGRGGASKN